MMHIPRTSLKRKLTWITALTGCAGLLVATLAIGLFDWREEKESLARNAELQAKVFGANCVAALMFEDSLATREVLEVLGNDPNVLGACVFLQSGEVLAEYEAPRYADRLHVGSSRRAQATYGPEGLEVFAPIEQNGVKLGTMFLLVDTAQLDATFQRYASIVALVLLASFLGTLLLSSRLQGLISHPILELARVAQHVSDRGDYSVRAEKKSDDEVGYLIEVFNTMLDQIQIRDEELHHAMKRVEEAASAKSQFLAMMSHEIRTPMNGIIGMTGLLLDSNLDAEQQEFADTVRGSANSLLAIVNDILDFSKIEAGKLEFEIIDCSLIELLEGTAEIVAQLAHGKRLELCCVIADDLPLHVRCDPGRLRQVLLNLLTNAVKFTESGQVTLSGSVVDRTDRHARLRFEVSDTGIGIPADRMHRLFESFSQVDASNTRKYGGTGLGLAICRQLVEQMGGEINVESEHGSGSTFWFEVDLETETSLREVPPVLDLEGLSIMVVDDNATNRNVLRFMLERWGCRPIEAGSGREALRILEGRAREIDLVLLDYQMPGMDGAEVLLRIRAEHSHTDLPVIVLTSVGGRAVRKRLLEGGAQECMTKPVKRRQLGDSISSCLHLSDHVMEQDALVETKDADTSLETIANAPRILVVEDQVVNQRYVKGLLRKMGYRGEVAANGLEAIRLAGQIEFDLILMDMMMPEMDGLEATRRMREAEKSLGRTVPIIGVTANASAEDRASCLAAGMDDYLSKPIDPQRLAATIRQWIERTTDGSSGEATAPSPPPAPRAPATPSPLVGEWRVLIAEDHPDNQQVAMRYMRRLGFESHIVPNGVRALEALEKESFDLILMDVMMPEMDGLEAMRRIRQRERETGEHTLIVAVTAKAMSGDREECLAAGADDFLSKPMALEDIERVVRSLLPETARPRAAPEPPAPLPLPRETWILLAEDNPVNQKVLSRVIEKLGYNIEVANNGAEALEAVHQMEFGMVLMDVMMPEMDGLESTRRIRQWESVHGQRIPIIGVSANTSDEDRRRGAEAGMDDYLGKPVRPADLREMLNVWMDPRRRPERFHFSMREAPDAAPGAEPNSAA